VVLLQLLEEGIPGVVAAIDDRHGDVTALEPVIILLKKIFGFFIMFLEIILLKNIFGFTILIMFFFRAKTNFLFALMKNDS
jgi:hypothetical protein